MFLEVVLQCLRNRRTDHTGHFGVTEFGLRLSLELRFSHFHRDNRRQTFTEIVRVDGRVTVFIFQFGFLEHLTLFRIFLHHTRQRSTETGYVRTTFDGVDVINVRVNVLVEIGVVYHRHFHRRTVFVGIEVNNLADERRTGTVDITNELAQTLLGIELLFLAVTLCVDDTFVLEHDLNAGIEERQLTHTVSEDLPVVNGLRED